jgi:Tfp pilus assembly protein PilO
MSLYFQRFLSLIRANPVISISVIALLIAALANLFLWTQRDTLAKQHDDARRYGEAMRPALASSTRLSAQVAATQEAVELIERNLIVESDLSDNNLYFYKLETASRARIAQFSQLTAQVIQGNPFKSVPFEIEVVGSYAQIIAFIRAVETGPRLARIREYSFKRNEARASLLSAVMTIEILGNK